MRYKNEKNRVEEEKKALVWAERRSCEVQTQEKKSTITKRINTEKRKCLSRVSEGAVRPETKGSHTHTSVVVREAVRQNTHTQSRQNIMFAHLSHPM